MTVGVVCVCVCVCMMVVESGWLHGMGEARHVCVEMVVVVLGSNSGGPVPSSYSHYWACSSKPAATVLPRSSVPESLPPGRRHCIRHSPPSSTKRRKLSQSCGAQAPPHLPSDCTRSMAVCSGNLAQMCKVRRSAQQMAHRIALLPMQASGSKSLRSISSGAVCWWGIVSICR